MNLVLTIIGPDRPGLVEALSQAVLFHDANWLDSRMAHLAGQFAGLLHIEVDDTRAEALEESLRTLEKEGLTIAIAGRGGTSGIQEGSLWRLELLGQDRPGIVRQVATALASLRVNVEELDTGCESAPMSGERLFRAKAHLRLPTDGSPEALREAVERVATELDLDLDLDRSDD